MQESPTVYGKFTRSVSDLWNTASGRSLKSDQDLRRFFSSFGLYPSKAQVHEMLQVARECAGRDTSPSSELISFGEVCLFTRELKKCYHNKTPRPPPLSKQTTESSHTSRKCEKNMPKSFQKYQVFLGGSCNPTTWRQDLAIPSLSRNGISFYNPQVSHWEEGLIELECQAKQNASILFFVFDPATRNVASMVECGFISGWQRKLVLVIDNYSGPGQLINGEAITQTEYDELSGGLLMVQDLVERQGIPVFSHVNHALNCTAKMLKENLCPQDLGVADKVQPVKYPHDQLGDKLVKLHNAFVNINSSKITLSEASVVFKVVTNREFTKEELQIIASKKGSQLSKDCIYPDLTLTFQEFCCIVAEFENQALDNRKLWDHLTESLVSPVHKFVDWALPHHQNKMNNNYHGACDVYLGGSQGSSVNWRETIAIPMLRKHGLSFFSPSSSSMGGLGERLLPMEASRIEKSRQLLFVITNTTRGVSQMALAAHYIGLHCNVVLCIQQLSEGTVINDEQLSANAIKDYNRGRKYLADQANKEKIEVFESIEEAVDCVLLKFKAR